MTKREWEEPLEEIWEIRRRIMAEFGNDRHRYFEHLMELQEHPEELERLISESTASQQTKRKPAV